MVMSHVGIMSHTCEQMAWCNVDALEINKRYVTHMSRIIHGHVTHMSHVTRSHVTRMNHAAYMSRWRGVM